MCGHPVVTLILVSEFKCTWNVAGMGSNWSHSRDNIPSLTYVHRAHSRRASPHVLQSYLSLIATALTPPIDAGWAGAKHTRTTEIKSLFWLPTYFRWAAREEGETLWLKCCFI